MKNFIYLLLLIVLTMMVGVANAEPVVHNTQACWTTPTENTDGSTLTNLAGFKVYTGTISGNYDQVYDFPDPQRTCAQFSEMQGASGDFYVVITAYNSKGVESEYSNEKLARGVIGGVDGGGVAPAWGNDQGNLHFEP